MAAPAAGATAARTAPVAPATTAPHSHSRDLGAGEIPERELRAMEEATLGPAHAAEHAEIRKAGTKADPYTAEEIERARDDAVARAAATGPADQVGRWNFAMTKSLPIVGIHAALLPTGKVMLLSYPNPGAPSKKNEGRAILWNPVTGAIQEKNPPLWSDATSGAPRPANVWCSGHVFTADGELVIFGGNREFDNDTTYWQGMKTVYTFNPFTETWKRQPDMQKGRWYPSGVRMGDGRIPMVSGLDETGSEPPETYDRSMNELVELFTPPATPGGVGSVSLIGETRYDSMDPDKLYPETGDYYPHMFAMPSGRAFVAGPAQGQSYFINKPPANPFWAPADGLNQRHLWGTGVPVPGGPEGSSKVMLLGGSHPYDVDPTGYVETYDEREGKYAQWKTAPGLNVARGHANTVLLPDGSMVHVGGGFGRDPVSNPESPLHAADATHKQIELWNPTDGTWRLGPPQAENRAYHSVAMLLPDGRVMSAGDEIHGVEPAPYAGDTAEIYEPPYLFKGPRPTISSAPGTINTAAGFGVRTPDTNVTRAALVAPSATTHAVDMGQSYIPLQVTRRNGCVDLTAPPNANVAPPGYYMLFLLNDRGVPSVAKFVKLRAGGAAPALCPPPVQPTDPTDPPPNAKPSVTRVKLAKNRISFRLSEKAKVTVTFERRRGGRYRKMKKRIRANGRKGLNRIAFNARRRGFAPGRYRLTVIAKDSTGKRSTPDRLKFTVKPR